MNAFLSRDHNTKQRQQAIRAYEGWAKDMERERLAGPRMLGSAILIALVTAACVALWLVTR